MSDQICVSVRAFDPISQAGIASRRKAEEIILEGRVQVNGTVVNTLGTRHDATRDHIRVDSKLRNFGGSIGGPDAPGLSVGPDGWLMRVEGNVVVSRERSAKGYGPEVRFEMSRQQLEGVLKLLLDNDVGNFPVNLYADHYTDFVVSVLDKDKNLQARRFAGMTSQTHGQRQQQFDRVFVALERLHRQALKEGKPLKN